MGKADIGDASKLAQLSSDTVNNARQQIKNMLDQHIDMMKPGSKPVPVILVGGGAILVQDELQSASQVIRPENAAVANAIGASIAQIGGEAEAMLNYRSLSREAAIQQVKQQASDNAIAAGAIPNSLKLADIEETSIPYMDDGNIKLRVKVIGEITLASTQGETV